MGLLSVLGLAAGCNGGGSGASPQPGPGTSGSPGSPGSPGSDGGGGAAPGSDGGPVAGDDGGLGSMPWSSPLSAYSVLRKVKGELTGLGPTDAEVASMTANAGALPSLIDGWMATPQFQDKLMFFFENAFQQSSLSLLDFEFQLRKRPGAFDLSYAIFGDAAFPTLFQNMKESFARTCLAIIAAGRPFTDVLTTQTFMMTTALKSLLMQIEMPYDIHTFTFSFNQGTRPALTDSLDPTSPNYMVFGYTAPTTSSGKKFGGTCAGDATKVSKFPGNTYLFQILLGSVPRDSTNNGAGLTDLGCMEHAAQPYFTPQDLADWQMVTVTNTGTPIVSYNLPALRTATTLPSKLPRVSFFTTPAFLAVWNTNDSNQHRVTANQALLAALGEGFTSSTVDFPAPPTLTAVDGEHAVTTSVCYGCHKSLDPMRQFWGNFYDYNDQAAGTKTTGAASFGFGNVTQNGTTLVDFGNFLTQVTDSQIPGQTVSRFALALTQKLCFFANSAKCEETDPEMRRVALDFENANFDIKTLVRELFSSPLVTSAGATATAMQDGVTISIARRDQLCDALSNRLNKPDLCNIAMPTPTDVTSAINRLAGALPADGFSRGTQYPVTSSDPNLFYRAASELVCESIAAQVVDATSGTVYTSTNTTVVTAAIEGMVVNVMGVPDTDPNHAAVVQALTDHFSAATKGGATATSALRSTFSAACQAPTTLSQGI